MAPVNRPNRIGVEGVTKQWSLREDENVRAAALAQARQDATNLSAIVRREIRNYLEYRGWDVRGLINGDTDAIDAQWLALLGRPAPRESVTRASSGPINPGVPMELF